MARVTPTSCCGVREITRLSDHIGRGKDALRSIIRQSLISGRAPRYAFYTFTQAGTLAEPVPAGAYGDQLKRAIEKYGLGTVIVTAPVVNPNSLNYVKVYVWAVNWQAAVRFHQDNL